MDRRGQASAEYLLLIVVILLVMGWLLVNVYQPSVGATMDVSKTSDASNAVNSIADAANLVYANGPGAKRTLNVYIPNYAEFLTGGSASPKSGYINMTLNVADPATNGATNKTVSRETQYPLITQNLTGLSSGWHQVTIEWMRNTTAYISVKFS